MILDMYKDDVVNATKNLDKLLFDKWQWLLDNIKNTNKKTITDKDNRIDNLLTTIQKLII
jgi:glucan phosphorylase